MCGGIGKEKNVHGGGFNTSYRKKTASITMDLEYKLENLLLKSFNIY